MKIVLLLLSIIFGGYAQIDTTSAPSDGWMYGGTKQTISWSNSQKLKPMHYVPIVQDPIYQSMTSSQKEKYAQRTVSQRQTMQRLQNRYTQAINSPYTTTHDLARLESEIMRLRGEMLTIAQQIIAEDN